MAMAAELETERCGLVAFPAKAVKARLIGLNGEKDWPSWTKWLPVELQKDHRPEVSCLHGSAVATTPEGLNNSAAHDSFRLSVTSSGSDDLGLFGQVPGHVWKLSRSAAGSRAVQKALAGAENDEKRAEIVAELRNHVYEASRCPHANYVLQKCIEIIPNQECQFIVEELASRGPQEIGKIARHRSGCRILERLIEHCHPEQVRDLVEPLLLDAISLCLHNFGNYVIQHLIEHGSDQQRERLIGDLEKHARKVGSDNVACAVVAKAMNHGSDACHLRVARALAKEHGLLADAARTRHGNIVAKRVLQVLPQPEQEEARRQLLASSSTLRSSRYGRPIATLVEGGGLANTSS